MADTTWDEWLASAIEYEERCFMDFISEPIFSNEFEEEDFDDEEDC